MQIAGHHTTTHNSMAKKLSVSRSRADTKWGTDSWSMDLAWTHRDGANKHRIKPVRTITEQY